MAFTKILGVGIATNPVLSGIITASNFKTGTSNLHNVGLEAAGINVLGGDTPIGTGATIFKDGSVRFGHTGNNNTGIVTANKVVATTVTATTFSGDGSNLTSLPAGLGTALSSTQTSPLNKLYYTDNVLSVGATITVDPPSSASAAYTQYTDIVVEDTADLIMGDGDDLVPDILGLSTETAISYSATGGRIRAGTFTNAGANGAPTAPNGWIVTGVSTTQTLSVTGNATISGNLGVAGTITYEDVARVDATGISTFREGFGVGPLAGIALTAYKDGSIRTTGIITASTFGSDTNSIFTTGGTERVNITNTGGVKIAGQVSGNNIAQISNHSGGFQLYGSSNTSTHRNIILCTASNDASERLRIDTGGRLLIGTATTKSAGSGQYAKLNVEGYVGGNECFMSLSRAEAASAMSADDEVANLTFNDLTGYEFARIQVLADAATGATDTPGRIVFRTTADGASSSTERLRIDSNGMSKFTRGSGGTVAHFYANARESNILIQNDARTWKIVNYDYGNNGSDNLGFHDGTADRMIIQNDGSVKIGDGDLIIGTSGHGIDFSATSGSGTSELFDDYEEGSWTPTFLDAAGSNISGGVNASYTYYTKIGRYVHCTYYWTLGDTGKNGADISLRSLPFAPTSPIPTMGNWWYDGGGVSSDFVGGSHNMVTASGGQVALTMPSTTWQQAGHRYLQFNDMTNGRPIYGCFSYFA